MIIIGKLVIGQCDILPPEKNYRDIVRYPYLYNLCFYLLNSTSGYDDRHWTRLNLDHRSTRGWHCGPQ